MSTLYLKYGFTAKPVLSDRDGETVGNWTGHGNHSISASSDISHGGTKSYKIIASDAGDATTNYVGLASGNNATFVVGQKYAVTGWGYTQDVLPLTIKTGGVVSGSFTLSGVSFVGFTFIFTALTATTALQIYLPGSGTVYVDDLTVSQVTQLDGILIERGMTEPDSIELFPKIQNEYLDGSLDTQIKGFRRNPTFITNSVLTHMDRLGILYWHVDNDRQIDYGTEFQVPFSLKNIDGFESIWMNDLSLTRQFSLEMRGSSIYTLTQGFPV